MYTAVRSISTKFSKCSHRATYWPVATAVVDRGILR
eukprot:SAG31_NODE_28394_length_410_cov_9.678457_1_plen_35_part_10